ncbi:MAG: hypothetical protein AB7O98_12820 [Hyphomonadaceae bacterium]
MEIGRTYMDAAFQVATLLNQVWGFYLTAILAVIAGLVFSKSAQPKQPVGRVILLVAALGIFFMFNLVTIAQNGMRLDSLLAAAGANLPAGGVPPMREPEVLAFMQPLASGMYEFKWEYTVIAHLVIDALVLVVTAWILLSPPLEAKQ